MIVFRFIRKTDGAVLKQIISLYAAQGWWGKNDRPSLAKKIIKNSHCFLLAMDDKAPIGMGRAISDRVSDAYIQDVMVLPQYRGQGIGAKIVLKIKNRLKNTGIEWVGLIAQNNSAGFYEQTGFKKILRAAPMMLKSNHV